MPVEIQAELNETNLLECRNVADEIKSRVNSSGNIITGINSGPSNLEVGECAFWFDGTNKLKFRARNATTVLNIEFTLT